MESAQRCASCRRRAFAPIVALHLAVAIQGGDSVAGAGHAVRAGVYFVELCVGPLRSTLRVAVVP